MRRKPRILTEWLSANSGEVVLSPRETLLHGDPKSPAQKQTPAGKKKGPAFHTKGRPLHVRQLAYFFPRMESLAILATRNFTTRLAGILIGSPVCGLRPMRALRLASTSLPTPGTTKAFFASR